MTGGQGSITCSGGDSEDTVTLSYSGDTDLCECDKDTTTYPDSHASCRDTTQCAWKTPQSPCNDDNADSFQDYCYSGGVCMGVVPCGTVNPCQNGGTCTNMGSPTSAYYICSCVTGYKGDTCTEMEKETVYSTGGMSLAVNGHIVLSSDASAQSFTDGFKNGLVAALNDDVPVLDCPPPPFFWRRPIKSPHFGRE